MKHVIHVKEIPHEINKFLKSLHEERNTWDSWKSCTMYFSFSLNQYFLLFFLNQCKHVINMCIYIQLRTIANGILSLHK